MSDLNVTSLEEIRAQAEPTVIEIPGFKQGTTIRVAVRTVDLTPHLLEAGIGNPLLGAIRAAKGQTVEEIGQEVEEKVDVAKLLPIFDAVAKDALVKPTYAEITAICPLTLEQKLAILDAAAGGIAELKSFRGQSGV